MCREETTNRSLGRKVQKAIDGLESLNSADAKWWLGLIEEKFGSIGKTLEIYKAGMIQSSASKRFGSFSGLSCDSRRFNRRGVRLGKRTGSRGATADTYLEFVKANG